VVANAQCGGFGENRPFNVAAIIPCTSDPRLLCSGLNHLLSINGLNISVTDGSPVLFEYGMWRTISHIFAEWIPQYVGG
jgi:hypothetical protein